MKYTFRREKAWKYEVVRQRDNKVVALLIRGDGWHIFSADSEKVIAIHIADYLEDAKIEFQALAQKRRGRF